LVSLVFFRCTHISSGRGPATPWDRAVTTTTCSQLQPLRPACYSPVPRQFQRLRRRAERQDFYIRYGWLGTCRLKASFQATLFDGGPRPCHACANSRRKRSAMSHVASVLHLHTPRELVYTSWLSCQVPTSPFDASSCSSPSSTSKLPTRKQETIL
jgi:hypothetical protein